MGLRYVGRLVRFLYFYIFSELFRGNWPILYLLYLYEYNSSMVLSILILARFFTFRSSCAASAPYPPPDPAFPPAYLRFYYCGLRRGMGRTGVPHQGRWKCRRLPLVKAMPPPPSTVSCASVSASHRVCCYISIFILLYRYR